MYRLDLGLYSHPKEFLFVCLCVCVLFCFVFGLFVFLCVCFFRMESELMLAPREKCPPPEKKKFPSGGWNPRRCLKQDSEPSTLPTSYCGPQAGFDPGFAAFEADALPPGRRRGSSMGRWTEKHVCIAVTRNSVLTITGKSPSW